VLLSFIADRSAYRLGLALANLAFLVLIVGWLAALAVGTGILLLHALIRLPTPQPRRYGLIVAGAILTGLFLSHKLAIPSIPEFIGLKTALAAIGFSYVALRGVELLRAAAEKRLGPIAPVDTINYLIPFNMLAAGPIQAYADFRQQQIPPTPLGPDGVLEAIERIARGLFKKFVLSNGLETLFLTDFRAGGSYFLFEAQVYYLCIYLDFSAYTDIAIGIGRLLGVSTPENFNNPLAARNIIVFWDRWHISLSQFIRRNVFIPTQLAAMRRTNGKHALFIASVAFTLSFLLVGLWHGISWRFLLWGAMHAAALVICNTYRYALQKRLGRKGVDEYMKRPIVRAISTFLTFEFVAFSLAFIAHPATAFLG
jgi:D-alanyl-lipoteichoic acid acyltransferase DltB (MBOAT superfamily)